MDWLANDDNPEYHRRVTGPAIVQSIAREGKSAVDAIVIGVGSGGTVTGVDVYKRQVFNIFSTIGQYLGRFCAFPAPYLSLIHI